MTEERAPPPDFFRIGSASSIADKLDAVADFVDWLELEHPDPDVARQALYPPPGATDGDEVQRDLREWAEELRSSGYLRELQQRGDN